MGDACLSSRARVLSRIVTGIYDAELGQVGIKASQLNLLVAIANAGPVRRTELSQILHLDSSTLTRNLRVMETNRWIAAAVDESDGRGRPVHIAPAGEKILEKAAPAWRTAQRRAAKALGADGKASLLQLLQHLTL